MNKIDLDIFLIAFFIQVSFYSRIRHKIEKKSFLFKKKQTSFNLKINLIPPEVEVCLNIYAEYWPSG